MNNNPLIVISKENVEYAYREVPEGKEIVRIINGKSRLFMRTGDNCYILQLYNEETGEEVRVVIECNSSSLGTKKYAILIMENTFWERDFLESLEVKCNKMKKTLDNINITLKEISYISPEFQETVFFENNKWKNVDSKFFQREFTVGTLEKAEKILYEIL